MRYKLCIPTLLMCCAPLFAQTDQAVLTGTVTDTTGAAITGAVVTALGVDTGVPRTVNTDGAGVYNLPALQVGRYTLTISQPGFASLKVDTFDLQVGQTRIINARLNVSITENQVEVQAASDIINETSASVGGVIAGEQTQNLPVNGRNWANLMALVIGAVDSGVGDQKSIRFAGRGQDDNNYRFDGIDATGVQNQGQRTSARLQISTDAIAEFRATSAVYPAESGGTAGGQVEVVTKSGGNAIHGSVYEFFRNDIFDARAFDNNGFRKLPFRLNQFGASVGGPIRKDKAFYFFNYEGIRQVLGQQLTGFVPSSSYRARVTNPALQTILNAYPVSNSATVTSSPDVAVYNGLGRQPLTEDSGLARVDYRFSDRTSAFTRFNTDAVTGAVPLGSAANGYLSDQLATKLKPFNAIISVQHIFSANLLNDTKFGFNRSDFTTAQLSALPFAVTVAGLTTLNNPLQKYAASNTFDFLDNASLLLGKHTLKTGVEVRRVQINQSATASRDLTVVFQNQTMLANNVVSNINLNSTVPITGLRKTEDFGYVQDEFKLRPNLTFNLGARYEFFSNFHEVLGRGSNVVFDPKTCGAAGFCPAGSDFYFPYLLNLAPRVAVVWSPLNSNGKTLVRTGYGVYFGDGQLGDLNAPVNNIATREALKGSGLTFPVDAELTAGALTSSAPRGLFRRRATQNVEAWELNVQQELLPRTVFSIGYLGTKGTHLFTRTFLNGLDPATQLAPIRTLGLVDYKSTDSNSNFHALQTTLQHDFYRGLLFQVNYQWSHSINDGAVGGGEALAAENVNNRGAERGSSAQDIRHVFSADMVWQLPLGRGKQFLTNGGGFADALVSGWQLSAIATARSGRPVNILISRAAGDLPDGNNSNQRPNRVSGVSLYPAGRTRRNWLNPGAFAAPPSFAKRTPGPLGDLSIYWGNLGTNAVRGPGIYQIDPALSKRTKLTEKYTVEFRAEAFNILNRAQLGDPSNTFGTATFGQIIAPVNIGATGTGTPRQLQFMLRLEF